MLKINRLYMQFAPLGKDPRTRVTETAAPCFSWSVTAARRGAAQTACRVRVRTSREQLWDSGWLETTEQQLDYAGPSLPAEEKLFVAVSVRDDAGEVAPEAEAYFYRADLQGHPLPWIAAPADAPGEGVYFRRTFTINKPVERACLYLCGLGYHIVTLNGQPLDDARLDPAVSDYTKTVYYVVLPEAEQALTAGENCLGVLLGEGWRRNEGPYLNCIGERQIDFFGIPQLSAALILHYADGTQEEVLADEHWLCGGGPIVYNHLFNGEITDSRREIPGWNLPGPPPASFLPAKLVAAPGGQARLMDIPPVREQEIYPARTISPLEDGSLVVDFGQNIAGVCRLRLPAAMTAGQTITIRHMELLDEDGSLYLPNLRGARCEDQYVAAGQGRDPVFWQPQLTYHGFRYAQITGFPLLEREDIQAVSLYTDVQADSFFSCGSGVVNAIQKAILQTEKSNLMGMLTDCPQRDERMGWLNDATVRFEETPYNFQIGRLFPKVVQDILDTQWEDGSITCTAPRVYGERPADPVCSSFLVAGLQALLHTGNLACIRRAYPGFVRWQECLAAHTENDIVTYSYYGDWAGPVYACVDGDTDWNAVHSKDTPGMFMSTGFYYYNAVLLSRFAAMLDKPEQAQAFAAQAERIRCAMLDKWWDPQTGKMATGSQGCQSFSLWLGILPEESRPLAARRLHEDLVARDYRMTTGNICTRYLMDALTMYGYVDDAWKLITREEYPSIGYMLQQEATTVWERFELKKLSGMNSHNHPMYGAVGYWFYAYIAGIRPAAPGFREVVIQPYFPTQLQSAHASVDTVKGELTVRWVKRYGSLYLYVTVPFGVRATVFFDGRQETVGSGYWIFEKRLEQADMK